MQNIKKKQILKISAIALLTAAMASIGVVLAIMSQTIESRANNFYFNGAEIELTEEEWDKEEEHPVFPGAILNKDPVIKNKSNISLYVFLEVRIPRQSVKTLETDDNHKPTTTILDAGDPIDLVTYTPDSENWIQLVDSDKAEDQAYALEGYHVCVYAYQKPLKGGDKTTPLFETVTFPDYILEGEAVQGGNFYMPINAYAIQEEYLNVDGTTPEEALKDAYAVWKTQYDEKH